MTCGSDGTPATVMVLPDLAKAIPLPCAKDGKADKKCLNGADELLRLEPNHLTNTSSVINTFAKLMVANLVFVHVLIDFLNITKHGRCN